MIGDTRVTYLWQRIEQLDQWWHWLLLLGVTIAVALFVIIWYRRDSVEHHRAVGWGLLLLRLAALTGLLLVFFQLDKRTEQRVVKESRVAVLVDTSLSMSLPGTPSLIGVSNTQSRADEATSLFAQSDFLQRMAARHQLSIFRFDQQSRPVMLGAIERTAEGVAETTNSERSSELADLASARQRMLLAVGIGVVSLLLLVIALGAQIGGARNWSGGAWMFLAGAGLMLVSMIVSALAVVPYSHLPMAAIFGAEFSPQQQPRESDQLESPNSSAEGAAATSVPADWREALQPVGIGTNLGDAIKSVLDRELGNPLVGIVIVTDGQNNAGVDPRQVITTAQNMRVPLYVVGLGSELSPPNLQLLEIDVPKRLYPGDRFTLAALVNSSGFEGRLVTVQITSGPKDADPSSLGIEAELQIEIPADGSVAAAQFELEPKAVGEWQYSAKVLPLPGDSELRDNQRSVVVEVIERKNRVLILAGGPTRDYQFVRNLLYRDRDVESHVLLQTGSDRSSQEAQELLAEFPADRTELSKYDAILAFDADWTKIPDRSVVELEKWVAEQAGGFLIVAGTVEMPKWVARSASGIRSQTLRSLAPVVLEQRGSSFLAAGRIESNTAWPLTITSDACRLIFYG